MKTRTVEVREGEDCGPIDWSHPTATGMPEHWRDAEREPEAFEFDYGHGARRIVNLCMYDGWPYWKPTPAVCYIGPLGWVEWAFFNSYGVNAGSVYPKKQT